MDEWKIELPEYQAETKVKAVEPSTALSRAMKHFRRNGLKKKHCRFLRIELGLVE